MTLELFDGQFGTPEIAGLAASGAVVALLAALSFAPRANAEVLGMVSTLGIAAFAAIMLAAAFFKESRAAP